MSIVQTGVRTVGAWRRGATKDGTDFFGGAFVSPAFQPSLACQVVSAVQRKLVENKKRGPQHVWTGGEPT